jgi:uncharacterized GH25 family protein
MRLSLPLLLLALGLLSAASAHEFWLEPAPAVAAPGDTATVALRVGMDFAGEPRPLDRTLVTALRRHDAAGAHEAFDRVPEAAGPLALELPLPTAGTTVLALDTRSKSLTLAAEKFTGYLREEGLDAVVAARAAAGSTEAPGRERYARCVKTLVRVGPDSDGTFAVETGQRLELVPLADPFRLRPGDTLRLRLLFERQPLAGALVRAWHRGDGRSAPQEARTGADGTVAFPLPRNGAWMFSVVHMVRVTDDPAHDWQSYWGNLTFVLPTP